MASSYSRPAAPSASRSTPTKASAASHASSPPASPRLLSPRRPPEGVWLALVGARVGAAVGVRGDGGAEVVQVERFGEVAGERGVGGHASDLAGLGGREH